MGVVEQSVCEPRSMKRSGLKAESKGAFLWLAAFYVVYCARPEDWIPGLSYVPLAKITGLFAFLGLLMSLNRAQRKLKDLPRESYYLLFMIGLLFLAGIFSPVWRSGAISHTVDFAKVYIAWILTFLVVSDFVKLKKVIFIQAASVAVICVVSVVKGHSLPRLEGVLGGIYSNPNDLGFAAVLSLPFCLSFLLTTKSGLRKAAWVFAMLCMSGALFLTASRGGLVTLIVALTVALWHFGVKGRRLYLIVAAGVMGAVLMAVAGGPLIARMVAINGDVESVQQNRAYESYEQRRFLMQKAVEGIEKYPVFGVGVRNFQVYSGVWRDVHMTYLQIAVEGGIPCLILYLLFFWRGFGNLRQLRRRKDLHPEVKIFVAALHSSLVGFVVGALFSPEAYQFFPYFAVVYTSTLLAIVKEKEESPMKDRLVSARASGRKLMERPVLTLR